jgi:hypothetical protein
MLKGMEHVTDGEIETVNIILIKKACHEMDTMKTKKSQEVTME